MTAQEKVGAWTEFHKLTPEDQQVFDQALAGLVGVHYTPELVSTQVVNGINYRYKTKASVPGTGQSYPATVYIYVAPNAKPVLTEIHKDA